jgi:hypothetical protein
MHSPPPSSAFGIPDQVRDRLFSRQREKGTAVVAESRSDIRDLRRQNAKAEHREA